MAAEDRSRHRTLSRLLEGEDDPVRLALRLLRVYGEGLLCAAAVIRGHCPCVGTPGAGINEGLSGQKRALPLRKRPEGEAVLRGVRGIGLDPVFRQVREPGGHGRSFVRETR